MNEPMTWWQALLTVAVIFIFSAGFIYVIFGGGGKR